jgi:hypothetical protein
MCGGDRKGKGKKENITFRKLDLFPAPGIKGEDMY